MIGRPLSERLQRLPEDLVELYPAHGFVISRDEARDLGLTILDLERYDYRGVVEELARRLDDEGVNCVRSVKLSGHPDSRTWSVPSGQS